MFSSDSIHELSVSSMQLMDGLLDVFAEAFEDEEHYSRKRPANSYLERLLGQPHFIALAAKKGGKIIGGLVAYELQKFEQERSEIYIYDLAVLAAYRRLGVATALIGRVREIARERGAWVVFVQADHGDDPAVALYTKLGSREDVMHFDIPPK